MVNTKLRKISKEEWGVIPKDQENGDTTQPIDRRYVCKGAIFEG